MAADAPEEESCDPVDAQTGVEGVDSQNDGDLAGEEDSGEVQVSRGIGQPRLPSERERRDHEKTHCPYRCWCEHCVRGHGSEYRHSTVVGTNADSEVPRVILDYCFFY